MCIGQVSDIERLVSDCVTCHEHCNVPHSIELHPWEWLNKLWSRLHADFAGPFLRHMFPIVVDAHSKCMDIYMMSTIMTEAMIGNLKAGFSMHGPLNVLMMDNGPSFKSEGFHQLVLLNGIQHLMSVPYHLASNGLAERAVQIFKNAIKELWISAGSGELLPCYAAVYDWTLTSRIVVHSVY